MVNKCIELLVCSSCKGGLLQEDRSLICDTCNGRYTVHDAFINMIDDTEINAHSLEREIKENEKRDYTLIAKSLEQSGIGRFATFLNYGYVPNDNVQYSTIELADFCLNINSVKLLLEVVGNINVHHKEVIDIGCGRGGNISALYKYFKPKSIAGLDMCTANIEFCSSRNRLDEVFFIVGDAEKIPFANESFDIVLNTESAHAYPNRNQFYDEVYRILRPNGVFLYTELMSVETLDQSTLLLKEMGFFILRNQNATSNVLLSCDDNAKQRTGAQGIANMDLDIQDLKDFVALPGSKKYEEMKNGHLEYRIMSLRKVG